MVAMTVWVLAAPAQARFVDNSTYSRLLRAGDPGGRFCALYIGYTRVGFRNGDLFHRQTCFSSMARCRDWFREVTLYFPEREVARRCAVRR